MLIFLTDSEVQVPANFDCLTTDSKAKQEHAKWKKENVNRAYRPFLIGQALSPAQQL